MLVLCAALAQGCIKGPATDRFQPLYDQFGEVSLAGNRTGHATYVLDGFSARWDKNPHRLNKFAAGMMLINNDPDAQRVTALGRLALKGGAYSEKDTYKYAIDYTLVRSKRIHFYHGEVPDIEIRHGQGERKIQVDLSSQGMALFPKDQIAVFLRGFYFDTSKSHISGFPVKKMAVEIKDVLADNEGHLSFTAHMDLAAGERNMYMHYGGEDLVTGKLFYTVAATRYGILTTQDHEYALRGAEPASKNKQNVIIQGAPGAYPVAFVGTQRFVLDWSDSAFLIRGARFHNRDFQYDPASGLISFVCDAALDNDAGNKLVKNKRYVNPGTASATFVLMQVNDKKGRVTHGRFAGESDKILVEHSALSFSRTFGTSTTLAPVAIPDPDTDTADSPIP